MLRKFIFARVYLLTCLEGALAAACHLAALYLLVPLDASLYLQYEDGAARIAVLFVEFIIVSYVFDFYKRIYTRSRTILAVQMCQLIGILLLIQAGMAFIHPALVLPQDVTLVGSGLLLISLSLWRIFLYPRVWNAFGTQQVLFVGYNTAVRWLARTFGEQAGLGMRIAGFLVDDATPSASPVLGDKRALERIVAQKMPDRIIVSEDSVDKNLLHTLFRLKAAGANVETAGHAYEALFGRIFSPGLTPADIIFRNDLAARPGSLALQSVYTNLLVLSATIIVFPVILLAGIALRLSGERTVLSKAVCAGLRGIPFQRYRFSSAGRIGRLLARLHLAGLPQVINVLRGEMALIGPRPESLPFDAELAHLIPFYVQKHQVKPGIIGWSQLHCDTSPTEDTLARLEYDLYYIRHVSLTLDAYIAIRALKGLVTAPPSDIASQRAPVMDAH
jgi:lipopolysaccharide/colanic/teichoic acid biosynthesis glycosyltransferase